MINSVEKAVRDVLSDEDFIKNLVNKIQGNLLIQYEDRAVTTELFDEAKFGILEHEVTRLINNGVQAIVIRGLKIV